MKRFVAFGVVGLLLATTTGCGGADSLMKEYIAGLNDLATAIEKKEPADKQKAIAEKLKATGEKLEKLKLSDDEKKKLVEKHKTELEAAFKRLVAASFAQAGEGLNLGDIMGGFGGAPKSTKPQDTSPQSQEK